MSALTQVMKDDALKRGVVKSKIVRVVYTAKILRDGWEMDNWGWIVETEKGKFLGLTTSHGSVCRWHKRTMLAYLKQLRAAITDVETASQFIGND